LLELQHRLPELLLMRADKMSMMHGIETRVPYLDHTVAEFALALPTNLKISWSCTKYLLKKVAERYLPKDVVYRKKQGFSVPLLHWFSKGEYFPQRLSSMTHAHGQLLSNLSLQNMSHHNTKSATKTVQQWSLLQLSLFEKNL
jgi:asparagine synthase (glutamine-hydrolysing)